jgi:hypothetical protein
MSTVLYCSAIRYGQLKKNVNSFFRFSCPVLQAEERQDVFSLEQTLENLDTKIHQLETQGHNRILLLELRKKRALMKTRIMRVRDHLIPDIVA